MIVPTTDRFDRPVTTEQGYEMYLSRRTFAKMGIAGTVAVGAAGLLGLPACSDRPRSRIPLAAIRARSVVLVHGLFADGSSWSEVIPLLQAAGKNVTSVQNPLTTLDDAKALILADGENGSLDLRSVPLP